MILNPYLGFNGNCQEAFEFNEKTVGAKILVEQCAFSMLTDKFGIPWMINCEQSG